MEGFDPRTNPDDKIILDDIIQNSIKKIAEKTMSAGKLEINGHSYDFVGVHAWVEIYAKWFDRKKKELSDKVDGYSKSERWDTLAKEVISFQDLEYDERIKRCPDFVNTLTKLMGEQENVVMDPVEVTKELDAIYGTIQQNVFKKLFKEEISLDILPAVWDGFMRHINAKQGSALNFYSVSPEMTTIIYEAGLEAKQALLPKS